MTAPLPNPILGIDEAWAKVDPALAARSGYHFIIGYISQDNTGKNLTPADVASIHAAGLPVVLNFEYNPQSAMGGAYAGTQDATIAIQKAHALGAPQGLTIYFSIDFPVGSDSALQTVGDYIGAAGVVCAGSGFEAGAYGGIVTVKYLLDKGICAKVWQTYAWSNGAWDDRAVLRQIANGVTVAGENVDRDLAVFPDFGQWNPGNSVGSGTTPAPQEGDDMLTHWRSIQQGATGSSVRIWQGILAGHGFTSSKIDGSFGPLTDRDTRNFQSSKGITVDGIAGPHSLSMGIYDHDYA